MPTEKTKNDRKSIDVDIGSRIRATREVLGVSQQALGEAIGVSYQQVQKYEQGINPISAATLVNICQSLQISPMEILGSYFSVRRSTTFKMGPWSSGPSASEMAVRVVYSRAFAFAILVHV